MEYADIDKTTRPLAVSCIPFSSSSPSSSRFSPPSTAFQGPCAACSSLDVDAMRVELPQPKRVDAVSSMVYEANARIRDPVYGCAGTISQLHKQVNDLKAELAMAQAELFIMQCQQQQQNANASFFLDRYLVSDYC
ncbi:LOB domain-containing protein 1 [Vitis vinifera]|uniref:LOB domain-containing protein 1 n=1 Tax=Vitis vinifera TaxID=29760 RepID=A0A438CGS2_VITVI|nr:LOB domain-containing protein 1 [Vitis vinifera]